MSHIPLQCCINCRLSNISETELFKHIVRHATRNSITLKLILSGKIIASFFESVEKNDEKGESGSLIFDNHGRDGSLLHGIFFSNDIMYSLFSPLSGREMWKKA